MNFLSPWFLAGTFLIAGPIIAHLIRRATRDRVNFSTTRFLSASAPRLNRRSRIQHPLLLALRCLIIAVLAAGFARPFLPQAAKPAAAAPVLTQSLVVVLDESASMQRAGLWDAARKKAADLAAGLQDGDQFVLLAAAGGVAELVTREQWTRTAPSARAALVRDVLAARQPGWGPTHFDTALETAVAQWDQLGESAAGTRRKIVLISDFIAGARVAGLAGLNWPKGTEVALESVAPAHPGNAGVQWLGWAPDTGTGPSLRVRVVQSADSPATSLRLQLRDAKTNSPIGIPQPLAVTPGESRVAVVPVPAALALTPLRVDLEGDAEAFDNTVWVVRAPPREAALVYYGGHAANDVHHPRFYLQRAIAGWKDPVVHFRASNAPAPATAAGSEVAIVAGPLGATDLAALRTRLAAGAFTIVLLNDPAMVGTAAALAGESGWTPTTPARKDALLGQIDFQHPLFSLFADPRFSDFTHVRFWHPQSVALPATTAVQVVARFDEGSPAVLEAPVGRGRLIVWGGDWEPDSGQWILSTKFVPWLQALFERAAGGEARPAIAEVGDTARLTAAGTASWRDLAGAAAGANGAAPAQPGVYQIEEGGATRWVALETPASESRVDPLPLETWDQLGVPLHATAVTGAAPLPPPAGAAGEGAAEIEGRQKLWRWLLIGAAALLAAESLFAYVLGHRLGLAPEPDSAAAT